MIKEYFFKMKEASKKQIKLKSTQILAIILCVVMVIGGLGTVGYLIGSAIPAAKLEKYVDKNLKLVSVVCEFESLSTSFTSDKKEKILNDMREVSGKKNASESELLEWYANKIKKESKANKLKFTSDMDGTTYYVAKYGENSYKYSISKASDGSYSSFSLTGASTSLNGTYRVDTSYKKLYHTAHLSYTCQDGTSISSAVEVTFYYSK
jgi:hypothetical protein